MTWRWVGMPIVHALHDRQIAEHSGGDGIRDAGAIESALARPQNLVAYGSPDAASLAAAYCYGIAKNHGFVDGNKRTAWVVARLFLRDNGFQLQFEKEDAVAIVEAVAASAITEAELADWFRKRIC